MTVTSRFSEYVLSLSTPSSSTRIWHRKHLFLISFCHSSEVELLVPCKLLYVSPHRLSKTGTNDSSKIKYTVNSCESTAPLHPERVVLVRWLRLRRTGETSIFPRDVRKGLVSHSLHTIIQIFISLTNDVLWHLGSTNGGYDVMQSFSFLFLLTYFYITP